MDTSEKDFETTIISHLVESGYRERTASDYDKSLCLDPELVIDFIRATQIKTWEKLKEQYGSHVKERFVKRLVNEIKAKGTLHVLRKGIDDVGCHFELAYFKPETNLNEEHRRLYNGNIFSVVRQLKYSEKNENSLDLAVFLNGLPVFTLELKNPAKGQTVENAIQQYRKNRDPKEPLLAFKKCLAHFAMDTDLVYMTTKLRGTSTRFLPFNKGHNSGSGNPPNEDGFRTAYFWEQILQKDSMLEIINHFLREVDVMDEDGKATGEKNLIFPRFHQLDAVRKLVAHSQSMGPGHSYLVEHSAGSGKSNTISWLAHQLAGLHDSEDKRVFDTILVITDRRVLDKQLRDTVMSFEQTKGLVSAIEKQKSKELAAALEEGKDIIITTLQTFPFVTEKITSIRGRNFAVLIDEAHSSQTGAASRSLKETLSVKDLEDAENEDQQEDEDGQDAINQRIEDLMKRTGRLPNVSFFAFTATPKPKTLELFGTEQTDGTFRPRSIYSMRQAIEEEFILDVLKNYTTFKVYFSLLKKIEDDPNYPKKKATSLLRSYADLHPHAINRKTEIMVEHFDTQVKSRINGQAKAMVVTRSRLHAVRYKQEFDKVISQRNLPYQALVAFSGVVKDPDTGMEFTESVMNGFPEAQTAATFKQSKNRFLIVAEKFQTGFDQPLLHTMYVDKKLSGVNAVQTLSRLNRTTRYKDDTMVLDFANDADEIQKSFQPYYETTLLSEATDPNKLYDLKRNAEEYLIYLLEHVEDFAKIYFSKKGTQQKARPILDKALDRFKEREKEEQEAFKKAVVDYVRMYSFLSHVVKFQDVNLEKTFQFLRHLRPLLLIEHERLPVEVTDKINMESYRIQQTSTGDIALMDEDGELKPPSDVGTGAPREEENAPLSEIITYINENFGTEFTDADKVRYFAEDMERRLADNEGLQNALNPIVNPSEDTRRMAFDEYFNEVLEDMIDSNFDIYQKIVENKEFGNIFKLAIFKEIVGRFAETKPQGHPG